MAHGGYGAGKAQIKIQLSASQTQLLNDVTQTQNHCAQTALYAWR